MATLTIPQAIDLSRQCVETGRWADAEGVLRQILAQDAQQAEAWHLLGVVAYQVGQHEVAVGLVRQALVLDPISPHYRNTMGLVRQARGELEEAIGELRCALQLDPRMLQARNNLGNALRAQGRTEAALEEYHTVLRAAPEALDARNNLGNALMELGRPEDAAAEYRQVLAAQPANPAAQYNLGLCLVDLAQWAPAAAAFRAVLDASPGFGAARLRLAHVLRWLGRLDEAMLEYRALLAADSTADTPPALLPDAHNGLGIALQEAGQIDEAIAQHRAALALDPAFAEAHNNLGNALKERGDLEGALDGYRAALALQPADANLHSNLVYALRFSAGADASQLRAGERLWSERHAAPLAAVPDFSSHDRDPDRRLKIGYVASTFWSQAECYFVLPLIEAHDRTQVEVHCFADVRRSDEVTARFRASADHWHDTLALDDAALAARIRAEGIDILIDLCMHMRHHRLLVFARRPAPVQVSWLAYPGSTGLAAIGYRLTDAALEPPEAEDPAEAEKAVRLPDGWCCYEPVGGAPEVAELPALTRGYVTFGSLNNPCKMNSAVLARWARTLLAVEGSRLLLLCPDGEARAQIRAALLTHGVAPERVAFTGPVPRQDYLALYARIDLGLDPFPYNGLTTTCDALWMGVPVLTVPGTLPQSRAGLSLLTAVGLAGKFVAHSEDEHLALAQRLASDLPGLAQLRATLRARMAASPLRDAASFARALEGACRSLWRDWTRSAGPARTLG